MSTHTLRGHLLDPDGVTGWGRVSWRDGRIVEVAAEAVGGGDAGAAGAAAADAGAAGPSAGVLDLPDAYRILPGFVDAHTHLLGLGFEFLRPNATGARSRDEVLARLADWLRANPGTEPVIGEGWDQSLWSDPEPPHRRELDRVAPDRAVALRRVCGHVAVLNSRALELVGTEWEGLDAESGLAREALPLALSRVWPPTPEQADAALRLGQEEAWRRGVTGVHEMGHALTFRTFGRAQAAGRLQLRVTHFFNREYLEPVERCGLVAGLGGDRLRVGGIKIFLDGSIGGRSAAVRAPYPEPAAGPRGSAGSASSAASDPRGSRGVLLFGDEELRDLLRRAFRAGFPAAIHAIGDAAIAQAVAAVESLRAEGIPAPPPGPRLEHAEMLDAELLDRALAAGFLFSMQPNFTARWQQGGALYEQILGPERARALNPYARVAATGRLLFGSDTMPLDPLLGLAGACGHPDARERLTLPEAVRHYTRRPAEAVSHPFGNGRLRPGAPADVAVVRAPRKGSWDAGAPLPDGAGVAATWTDGELRWADEAFRSEFAGALA